MDRAALQKIAVAESKAVREDDLFDLEDRDVHLQYKSNSWSDITVDVGVINKALIGVGSSPIECETERSSAAEANIRSASQQDSWKPGYAHKLLKRSKQNESAATTKSTIPIKILAKKRPKTKKVVQGNVTGALSPSGKVRMVVTKDSDDDSNDPVDIDDDDDW